MPSTPRVPRPHLAAPARWRAIAALHTRFTGAGASPVAHHFDRCRWRHTEPTASAPTTHALIFHGSNDAKAKIQREGGSSHKGWPPSPAVRVNHDLPLREKPPYDSARSENASSASFCTQTVMGRRKSILRIFLASSKIWRRPSATILRRKPRSRLLFAALSNGSAVDAARDTAMPNKGERGGKSPRARDAGFSTQAEISAIAPSLARRRAATASASRARACTVVSQSTQPSVMLCP